MATKKRCKPDKTPPKNVEPADIEKDASAEKVNRVKPRNYKKTALEKISKSYNDIVDKLAEKAAEGSVRHTELLFDLGGVKEEVKASHTRTRKEPSLGKMLLEEIESMKCNKAKPPDSNAQ